MKPHILLILLIGTSRIFATESISQSVNATGLDIFRKISAPSENSLISPYSIQSALMMPYAGAADVTKKQMAATLHLQGDEAITALSTLEQNLLSASSGKKDGVTLSIANRLFGKKGYPFHKAYLTELKKEFHAPLEEIDFSQSTAAAAHINEWVAHQTRNRITDIVPAAALNIDTRLVLINALYFKGVWNKPFETSTTHSAPFHLVDGRLVEVPTMSQTEIIGYARHKDFTAIALPYEDSDFQFLVLLPKKNLAIMEASLSPATLIKLAQMRSRLVTLHIPRFRTVSPLLSLKAPLEKLGMPSAFDIPKGSADFSGIAPRIPAKYLFISDIFHKAFVEIDEKGTEAAAATVSIWYEVGISASKPKPLEVKIDRPFFFAIQHRPTGTCLFLGHVVNPAK